MAIHRPRDTADLCDLILQAGMRGASLEVRGGGTCLGIGKAREAEIVDMGGFAGVIDYDPAELVLTAGAGTPLTEIVSLLARQNQYLAFDPWDMAPLFGRAPGRATLGGIIGAGQSGSRRVSAGAARDHLLGICGVSGRGESFKAGGRVVKNVTGYDLPKLMAGSWGRLAALTTVTLKVMPLPRTSVTRCIEGLSIHHACQIFNQAMGTRAQVAAAAFVESHAKRPGSVTALRLDGFDASVAARTRLLDDLIVAMGVERRAIGDDDWIWAETTSLTSLPGDEPLWRVGLPGTACAGFVSELKVLGGHYLADWAGARVWASLAGNGATLRQAASRSGGHATLIRDDRMRMSGPPVLHPPSPGLGALEDQVRRAFDPLGVFETGRFA